MTLDICLEGCHTIVSKIIIDKLITFELENWICYMCRVLESRDKIHSALG